jgi:hypothetical protein
MLDNLYKDQIMVHPSRDWTKGVVQSLHLTLTQHGWRRLSTNGKDRAKYVKNHKTLVITLAHNPSDECDYYIGDAVTPWTKFDLYPEVFGIYAHDFTYQEQQPSKVFNCFINRGCATRQSWFYFMTRANLLDQGHVSFWCEDRFDKTSPQEYSELLFQTYNRDMFSVEHAQMRDKIPYKNFNTTLEEAIIDSSKSLVIETFFEPNEHICYTEKTWRAIQMPRPMLLFSAQNAIQYLRDWGFDVFDDYVDHSYDSEPNKFVRQQMILNQLEKPVAYHPTVFDKKARHNRELLKSYQQQWNSKYQKVLDNIAEISTQE